MKTLGTLEEITDLRTVWAHEAHDFTQWLADDENISLLAKAVNLQITVEETESYSGKYRADILASEVRTGQKIIIENQLEDFDHKHMGQAITYAAGKEAEIIIWVVKHADSEHRAAIRKMNNDTVSELGYFLCEIRLYRIDDSKPAVKFEVIEKPAEKWFKKFQQVVSVTEQKRNEYSLAFQEYAFQNKTFAENFKRPVLSKEKYMKFNIGSSACHLDVAPVSHPYRIRAYLYIDDDKDLFRKLHANKDAIESETGLTFDWQELPAKKASRIEITKQSSFDDKDSWQEQFDWLIDLLPKMKKTFCRYL